MINNSKLISTRHLSYTILQQVLLHHQFSNKLINQAIKNYKLSIFDKNLLVQIIYGTIKNKILLDNLVEQFLPNLKIKLKWKVLIWMSLYQKLFLNAIPNYAIINESVKIAKLYSQQVANFINFTLHKLFSCDLNYSNYSLLIKYSFPEILFQFLIKQYGVLISEQIVVNNLLEPKISARVNFSKISREELISKYSDLQILLSEVSNQGVIFNSNIINHDIFTGGNVILQDEMSMKVVEILDPQPTEKTLDMCSAPGGKTTYIAQLTQTGIVDAYDISEQKMILVKENANKLGIKNISYNILDSNKITKNNYYDRILLDAPCSGFGVWKRKPEIKYNFRTEKKWKELLTIQQELLTTAVRLLKPGGILVYSTCTFNKWENNDQISKFLINNTQMKKISEKQYFGYEFNTDGFYWCKMKKNL